MRLWICQDTFSIILTSLTCYQLPFGVFPAVHQVEMKILFLANIDGIFYPKQLQFLNLTAPNKLSGRLSYLFSTIWAHLLLLKSYFSFGPQIEKL
jgi:hypothetical protein